MSSLFIEEYNDNRAYSLKHGGPVSHRIALNIAIDSYRRHDKRKVELSETHVHVTDHGWMQIEFRDFIEVLIKKLDEEETKILIVLLKLYQLDVYVGTDLFDNFDFYNEVIVSDDFIKIALERKTVSGLAVATICGMMPRKNNRRYKKSLMSLKKHIEQMEVTVFDLFGATASVIFTQVNLLTDDYTESVVFQPTQPYVACLGEIGE